MKENKAFTIAEILISLTIIGIIATLTLPALNGNVDAKKWITQRQALYSRMAQAINTMPGLNGYGIVADNPTATQNNAAITFINELHKVYKMNTICEYDNIEECGINVENNSLKYITNLNGTMPNLPVDTNSAYMETNDMSIMTSLDFTDIKPAAFETTNGEAVFVQYNPYCTIDPRKDSSETSFYMYNKVCANFIYDLNGTKGPNIMGKDIGIITALYAIDSVVVAPMPVSDVLSNATYQNAMIACPNNFEASRLPNVEEAISMRFNYKLFNSSISEEDVFWTNSFAPNNMAWTYGGEGGTYAPAAKTVSNGIWCVQQ